MVITSTIIENEVLNFGLDVKRIMRKQTTPFDISTHRMIWTNIGRLASMFHRNPNL